MNSPAACRTEHIRHIILWSKWVGAIHNEAQIDVEYWMTTDKSSCLLSTSYTSGDYYELTNNNNITEYNNPSGEHIQHESSNDNRWDRSSPIELAMLNVCVCVCVWMSWVGDIGGCWLTEWWAQMQQVTLIDGEQSHNINCELHWVGCVVYVCVLAVSEMSAIRHIQ
jgi:hypothetical protein